MAKFSNWSHENLAKFAQAATQKMLERPRTDALKMVQEQAEDAALWCKAATATEAHLQQALRWLHYAVEQSQADRIELLEAQADHNEDALEMVAEPFGPEWRAQFCAEFRAADAVVAQAAQERAKPVAWLEEATWSRRLHLTKPDYGKIKWRTPKPKLTPLYTHPAGEPTP